MNTGMQDAFNLGWKLALVCGGVSEPSLLDSYETERRPVAMRVAESGEAVDRAQGMTDQSKRAERDAGMRQTFGDLESAHHEVVATAELDRSYAHSHIVTGDVSDRLAPGHRLPGTGPVQPAGGDPCALHELTHRTGHTLLVIGGRQADSGQVRDLLASIEEAYGGSPVVSPVIGLCPQPAGAGIGRIDASDAAQLGIDAVTVLAVRPDRYVGFRGDGTDPASLGSYLAALTG